VSYERLVSWGCTIIDPQISERQVIMAPIPDILACLKQHFETPGD